MDENRQLSDAVYKVEEDGIQKDKIIKRTHELVLDTIDTNKSTIVDETDAKKNSMQAMVTATIKDEYKCYNIERLKKVPGYPESVITKHITITYAGTSTLKDWHTNFTEIFRNDKKSDGAFHSALIYAEEVEKKYPKEKGYTIFTTGHSLGGAEAIYVAVLRGYNAITYGAAGSGLTKAQIKNYKGLIVNLYDTSDIVTTAELTGGQSKIPFYSFGIDNAGWGDTFGHGLDQFHVDPSGNYIDRLGNIAVYVDEFRNIIIDKTLIALELSKNKCKIDDLNSYSNRTYEISLKINHLKEENKLLQTQLNQIQVLHDLRITFTASGGGLSSAERIYLDDSQALAMVRLAAVRFEEAMSTIIDIYKQGIFQLEKDWHNALRIVQQLSPNLSYEEIITAMNLQGCNQYTMVNKDAHDFHHKISKIYQINDNFQRLANEIDNKIHELVQRDQELANQIKGVL